MKSYLVTLSAFILFSQLFTGRQTLSIFESTEDKESISLVEMKSEVTSDINSSSSSHIHVPWRSYGVLATLLLAFTSNQWSRQLINYLCNFSSSASSDSFRYINIALGFDQEFYAALASFAFNTVYATISLFAGTVADSYDRRVILALSCFVWSLITLAQSTVTEAWQLIPIRIILGASQAFFNPAAYTILSDIFPNNMLASVNSVLSSGVYVGGGLASLSILLDIDYGWRMTTNIVGVVGIFIAMISFVALPEPRKCQGILGNSILSSKPTSTLSVASTMSPSKLISGINSAYTLLLEVLSIPDVRVLLFASLLRFAAGFTIAIWKAPFVYEKFPGSEQLFSSSNAFIITAGGLISSLVGGVLADRISQQNKKSKPRSRMWIPAIGSLLAVPAWTSFILASNPTVAAISLLAEYLVAECWVGPTLAVLYAAVPTNRRGTTQGIFSILVALGNIAPYIVGILTGGSLAIYSIGSTIMWMVNIAYFISGIAFAVTAWKEDHLLLSTWSKKTEDNEYQDS